MKKLKWKYYKKAKQWWINESTPYASDGMKIDKTRGGKYYLQMDYPEVRVIFRKLKDAKKTAQMIYNG